MIKDVENPHNAIKWSVVTGVQSLAWVARGGSQGRWPRAQSAVVTGGARLKCRKNILAGGHSECKDESKSALLFIFLL